jgi:hypothetical protein
MQSDDNTICDMFPGREDGDRLTRDRVAGYRWLLGVVVMIVAGGEFFAVQVGRYQWVGGLVVVAVVVSAIRARVGRSGLSMIMGLRRHREDADKNL